MPAYQYWAMTEIGDTVPGRLTATSPDAASHLLTLRGLTVRRLEEVPDESPPAEEPAVLSDEDFDIVATHLETITQHRLPLATSLRTLAEESPRPRLRRAIFNVTAELEQGRPLDEALGGLRSALPRRMAVLFEDGAHTGRLPFLIQHAVDQFRRTAELRRHVARNLMYPLILALIALLICGAIFVFIVPAFKRIFDDFGAQLPGLTMLVVKVSDLLVDFAIPLSIAALFFGVVLALILYGAGGRNWWHAFLSRLPLVGSLFRAASLSGFCRLLAVLVESGYSLTDAFRIAAAVNDDAKLAAGAQHVITDLEQGISPVDAVRVSEAFPRELLPVFRWADQRNLFIEALQGAADIYAARTQMNSGIVAVVLEPVAMFVIGISMGLVVLALFMPLIKLLNDLA